MVAVGGPRRGAAVEPPGRIGEHGGAGRGAVQIEAHEGVGRGLAETSEERPLRLGEHAHGERRAPVECGEEIPR